MTRTSEIILVSAFAFAMGCVGIASVTRANAQRELVAMQRDASNRSEDACYAQGKLARTRPDTVAAIRYCGEINQLSPFRPLVITR